MEKKDTILLKVPKIIKIQKRTIISLAVALIIAVSGAVYTISKNRELKIELSAKNKMLKESEKTKQEMIDYFLIDFVTKTRTIYKERAFYDLQVSDKMYFLTDKAKEKLKKLFETSTDTKTILENQLNTSVIIDSITEIEKNKKYQIFYEEIIFNNGKRIKSNYYNFVIKLEKSEKVNFQKNPLGIMITDLELKKIKRGAK